MRFSPSFLDDIRDRIPISEVIGRRVVWDRKKSNPGRGDHWACCPFHGEKSPSFHCEDQKSRYHCFGCGVSGDHFRFLTELEGLSFPEAVERLAGEAGLQIPDRDPQMEKREEARATILDAMRHASLFFQGTLHEADGAKARAYLRDRGMSPQTQKSFGLGYAPNSRNRLKEYLAGKGVGRAEIEAAGLVVHGEEIAVSYDRFRDRIMFPIVDLHDKPIAFGGRAMAADAQAKYLNSPETEVFHKGQVLFNLARARRAAKNAGTPDRRRGLHGRHHAGARRLRKRGRAARHGADRAPARPLVAHGGASRSSASTEMPRGRKPPIAPPSWRSRSSSPAARSASRCCPTARTPTIWCAPVAPMRCATSFKGPGRSPIFCGCARPPGAASIRPSDARSWSNG